MENNIQNQESVSVNSGTNRFSVSATKLHEFVSYASTLVDEATIEVTSEGWNLRTMDPSHVGLIDMKLGKEQFNDSDEIGRYPEISENFKFGVRIDELEKALKTFKGRGRYVYDPISVTIENNTLVLSNENISQTIRLIESSCGSTPLPKLTYNAEVIVNPEFFLRALEAVYKMSEYVTIQYAEPEFINEKAYRFILSGKGDSGEITNKVGFISGELRTKETDATVEKDGVVTLVTIPREKEQHATYSLDYILRILKIMKTTGQEIVVEFSTKMPVRIRFAFEKNHFETNFYLAPRIQD